MRKLIHLSGYSLVYFAVLFFIASCNTGTEGNEAPVVEKSTTTTESEVEQTKTTTISGILDNLYIDAVAFNSLPKSSLVLSFAFRTKDTLTLYGWSCKNNLAGKCTGFNTNPNIKLIKYGTSGIAYGPEVNFGNVILLKDEIRDIKTKLGTTYKNVVFVPKIIAGFIYYSIHVTNDDPALIKVLALEPTGIEANPSPPKGYNE